MLSRFKNVKWGRYPYFNWIQLLVLTSTSVFILLIAVEKKHISFLLAQWKFYETWCWQVIIASLLACYIIGVTRWLDYKHPWKRSLKVRLPLQLRYGVGLAIALTIIAVAIYYGLHGRNLLQTKFLRRYLPYDVLAIMVFNAILYFKLQQAEKKMYRREKSVSPTAEITIGHPLADIAYFHAREKRCVLVTLDGEWLHWQHSLKATLAALPSEDFFLVNRSYILSRKAILLPQKARRGVKLILVPDLALQVSVSKENVKAFNQWFDKAKKLP